MAAQPNYTPELTSAIIADYEAGKDVAEIAEAIGKSVRSVRSKLVREGVYQAPEKPVKQAKVEGPSKKDLLNELEALVAFDVTGLMGATKAAIADVIALAQSQVAQADADAQPEVAQAE